MAEIVLLISFTLIWVYCSRLLKNKQDDMSKELITEIDYKIALERFEDIFSSKKGTLESDESDELSILIKNYEDKNFIINSPEISKIITLTVEELEHEIEQAFVHGQGNSIMMEAGLERNEREDYISSVMSRLTKSKEDDERTI